MDLNEMQTLISTAQREIVSAFQKVPGSAVIIRYVQSSYQNDPIRSAIELILVLFFIRYLLSPSYSTHKQNFITLREDVWKTCPPISEFPLQRARTLTFSLRKSTSW
jgi:serine palmitoyltransferase